MADVVVDDPGPSVPVPVGKTVHDRLQALADACDTTVEKVVEDAAGAHLQVMAGSPVDPPGRDFCKVGSDREAQVVIRQTTDVGFVQLEPFHYASGSRAWTVPAGAATDLASVPKWMTWLVPRYGRHTLPALLHDHLQDAVPSVSSWEADEVFRDSMGATGVPFVRRWVMWAAVAMRTLLKKEERSWPWWILLVVWLAVYGIGAGVAGWIWMLVEVAEHAPLLGVVQIGAIALAGGVVVLGDSRNRFAGWGRAVAPWLGLLTVLGSVALPVALAVGGDTWVPLGQLGLLLSPVVTGGFWWRRAYRVGAIAGVGFSLLAAPALFVVWALLVYRAAEALIGRFAAGPNPVTVRDYRAERQADAAS